MLFKQVVGELCITGQYKKPRASKHSCPWPGLNPRSQHLS